MKKIYLFPKFSSKRIKPKNLVIDDISLFSHEYEKNFPGVYYIETKNATVINKSVYSFRKLRLLTKYSYFYKPRKTRLFKDVVGNLWKSINKSAKIKSGIWITDNKSSVYFHFLCDALMRYQALPNSYKKHPVLIPYSYDIDWIKEILLYLKIEFIVLEHNTRTRVEDLFITSYTAPSGNFHKATLINLRENFLKSCSNKSLPEDKFKKVWIDMSYHRRSVVNMEEIRPVLRKNNFTEVAFEKLTVEEKIKLMNNVEILAGSHSSGLTNMLFMKSGSKVIDIRDPRDKVKNAFFTMASELSIEYYYMEREPKSPSTYIDPKKLQSLLSSIC
ncbi:glycosyltransferase family 61 protein [Acidimicrobiia bacterium]|nr:glycosyltransferase family 61 protein [Acidimicrobiia bacterium]